MVDDNRDGILIRKAILEELGYQVTPAHNGTEALSLTEGEPFDLIVTDYRMSDINGIALLQELRARKCTAPAILLTGFADTLGFCKENTGADIVIQKSANEIASLQRAAHRLLGSVPRKSAARSAPQARSHASGQ